MLRVCAAAESDLERILEVYAAAREYMIRSGNPDQWGRSYPPEELILSDIRAGACRVIRDDEGIHGVFAVFSGEEPTYAVIEDGEWLNPDPYVTIHRMAGDGLVHGLFRCAADYCKSLCPNVRIDTHDRNMAMRHLIWKNGFRRCGTIRVRDGSPRIAYQWTAGE